MLQIYVPVTFSCAKIMTEITGNLASGVAPTSHSTRTLPDKSGFNVMKNLPAGPGDFADPNFDGPISAWNGGGGGILQDIWICLKLDLNWVNMNSYYHRMSYSYCYILDIVYY